MIIGNQYKFGKGSVINILIIALFIIAISIIYCSNLSNEIKLKSIIILAIVGFVGMTFGNRWIVKIVIQSFASKNNVYQYLIETMPEAFIIIKNRKIVFINNFGVKLLGMKTSRQVVGRIIFDFFPQEYHDRIKQHIEQSLTKNPDSPSKCYKIIKADNSLIDVEFTAISLNDKNIGSVQIFIKDISGNKRAKLVETEQNLLSQYLAQFTNVCFWKCGLDKRIIFINNFFKKYITDENSFPQSADIINLIHPDDKKKVFETYYNAFEFKKPYSIEFRMCNLNGKYNWLLMEGIPSFSENKHLQGFVGHCFDITERKVLELEMTRIKEKSEESDKLKSSFLANLSHEIRTPMNAIIGFTSFLSDDTLSSEKRDEYIGIIRNSSFRLLSVISDTIEISRLSTEQISVTEDSFELQPFLVNLMDEARGFLSVNKKVVLNLDCDRQIVDNIICDKNKLYSILHSLLSNAVKYTNEGSVALTSFLDGNNLIFMVRDTGIGIDKKDIDLVFERFYRVENTDTIREGGIGLGLSIAQEYIKLMQGTISISSQLGVGTNVTVNIPIKLDRPEFDKEQELSVSRILLVEDDDYNYTYVSDILDSHGFVVERALNGATAVNKLKFASDNDYALVLMDIKMPEMDGYQAIRLIREFNKKIPIFAQTAYALSEDKERIAKSGFDGFIAKPLNITMLLNIVRKYVKVDKEKIICK